MSNKELAIVKLYNRGETIRTITKLYGITMHEVITIVHKAKCN